MEAVGSQDFLRWANGVGIGFDPRYPESGCLSMLPPDEHTRFWVLPADPGAWPEFVGSLLDSLDDWRSGLLWPRSGSWPQSPQSAGDGIRSVILRGAGVPVDWPGAIRFRRDEEDALIAVLYAYLAFGWCVDDDLFFIPDHGRQLLQTDHHDVVHVQCQSGDRVRKLVEQMANAGYDLPTDLPDETFKRPAWMDNA